MYRKRLWICILGGVISAAVCLIGSRIIFGFTAVTWEDLAATVANRLLLGFALGISCWRISHFLHGAVLGFIFSLSVSIGFISDNLLGFFLYTTAGIIYGVFIEWLATDLFKVPMKTIPVIESP